MGTIYQYYGGVGEHFSAHVLYSGSLRWESMMGSAMSFVHHTPADISIQAAWHVLSVPLVARRAPPQSQK